PVTPRARARIVRGVARVADRQRSVRPRAVPARTQEDRAPGRAVEGERLIGASFAESLHELSAGGAPRPALQGTRDPRGPVRVRARPGDSPEGSQEEIGVDVVLDRRPRDLARVIDLADVFVRGFV